MAAQSDPSVGVNNEEAELADIAGDPVVGVNKEEAELADIAAQSDPGIVANNEEAELTEIAAQVDPVVDRNNEEAKPKKQDKTSEEKYPQGYIFGSEDNFFKYGFLKNGLPANESERWKKGQSGENIVTGNEESEGEESKAQKKFRVQTKIAEK